MDTDDIPPPPKPPPIRRMEEGVMAWCDECGSTLKVGFFERFFRSEKSLKKEGRGCIQPECENYHGSVPESG